MSADRTLQTVVMRDGRSAGFGFVEFKDGENPDETADSSVKKAIEEMNNAEYVHIPPTHIDILKGIHIVLYRSDADAFCG